MMKNIKPELIKPLTLLINYIENVSTTIGLKEKEYDSACKFFLQFLKMELNVILSVERKLQNMNFFSSNKVKLNMALYAQNSNYTRSIPRTMPRTKTRTKTWIFLKS